MMAAMIKFRVSECDVIVGKDAMKFQEAVR
jgi:hypothetical protein